MSAETVALALYTQWICLFGTPLSITTDQGTQFESALFNEIAKLIGAERIRTTAYHPQSNGMVERWHRTLKAALMCNSHIPWPDLLPTVLLGLRSAFKEDIKSSPAELLFGTALRLPHEFFGSAESGASMDMRFTEKLRQHIRTIRATPASHHSKPQMFFAKDLNTCTHVFRRVASVKKPLEQPYTGPHEVVRRVDDKVYIVNINGEEKAISVDLLKPAFLANVDTSSSNDEPASPSPNQEASQSAASPPITPVQLPEQISFPSPADEVTEGGVDVATQPQRYEPDLATRHRRKQTIVPRAILAVTQFRR
jgi:hypothetical protein